MDRQNFFTVVENKMLIETICMMCNAEVKFQFGKIPLAGIEIQCARVSVCNLNWHCKSQVFFII
jgi:hypothetical protein